MGSNPFVHEMLAALGPDQRVALEKLIRDDLRVKPTDELGFCCRLGREVYRPATGNSEHVR